MGRWPVCVLLVLVAVAERDGDVDTAAKMTLLAPQSQTASSLLQKTKNTHFSSWPPTADSGKFDAWELDYMTDSSDSGKKSTSDVISARVAVDNGKNFNSENLTSTNSTAKGASGRVHGNHGDIVHSTTSTVIQNINGSNITVIEKTTQYADGTVEKERTVIAGSADDGDMDADIGSGLDAVGNDIGNASGVENSSCVTREEPRASALGYTTAEPGTPCVFGVDDRDEGGHCIMEDGKYGSFGWCYTNENADSWGSCSESCPLFGPPKVLAAKIEKFQNELKASHKKISKNVENLSAKIGNLSAAANNLTAPNSSTNTSTKGSAKSNGVPPAKIISPPPVPKLIPIGGAATPEPPVATAATPEPPAGEPATPEPPVATAATPVPPAGEPATPEPPAGEPATPDPPVGGAATPEPSVSAADVSTPEPPAAGAATPEPPAGGAVTPEPPAAADVSTPEPPATGAATPEPPVGGAATPEPLAGEPVTTQPPVSNAATPEPPAGGPDTGPPADPAKAGPGSTGKKAKVGPR